jgi:MFS transporter, FSR family, fosmidomycin resistance protein
MMDRNEGGSVAIRSAAPHSGKAIFPILFALSFGHLINDTIQVLIPAIYPLFKKEFRLSFSQIGLITFTFQLFASLLQPLVGYYTDHRPLIYSLCLAMGITIAGLGSLSLAADFRQILLCVALIGIGSAIFHPEATRITHLASGGRHGMAQAFFQTGGSFGNALGVLVAAMVVVPFGQVSLSWVSFVALASLFALFKVGRWYKDHLHQQRNDNSKIRNSHISLPRRKVVLYLTLLIVLVISKFLYTTSILSYYTFYLIERFGVSVQNAQIHLFIFWLSMAVGTLIGGPIGDRIGRKYIIWISILGAAPFTLLLPYVDLFWTGVLTVVIGLILSSALSAIIVYAQELLPGKEGMVGGLFFGLAFGVSGIGSALWGKLADYAGVTYVFWLCSFSPLLGLLTGFLPHLKEVGEADFAGRE